MSAVTHNVGKRVQFGTPRNPTQRLGTVVGVDTTGRRGAYYVVQDEEGKTRKVRAGYIKAA